MTKLIIATKHDDIHAISVKLALNKLGYIADLLYTADFPSCVTYSFDLGKNKFNWIVNEKNHIQEYGYDIMWYRRPEKPKLPDFFHPDDIKSAEKEITAFFQSIWYTILPNARWINPVNAAKKANSKLLQLKLADQVHLNIPETLISNNPHIIKNFIKKGPSIYKSLHAATWISQQEMRLTYTNNITIDQLPTDKILQSTPGIFQKKIEKKHELRVTYFGTRYVAVKIDSQQSEDSKLDWRKVPTHTLALEEVKLPKEIDSACQDLMQKLGIVFGCFDFIVTPDDEYYFLEVNEQGQFLWIEAINPEIKMLQAFIEFIINKKISLSLQDVKDESEHFMSSAIQQNTLSI